MSDVKKCIICGGQIRFMDELKGKRYTFSCYCQNGCINIKRAGILKNSDDDEGKHKIKLAAFGAWQEANTYGGKRKRQ